ncbi:MAG: hypothetical protein R3223_05355 [Longimicrobiales bacterium]|nr:hypothetical protein [Longimicrobiales bacterium]
MKASIIQGRSVALVAVALLATGLSAPASPALAQQTAGQGDAVERNHPYLADLLDAFDSAHGLIYQAILNQDAPTQRTDLQTYNRLVRDVLANPGWQATMTGGESSGNAGMVPDVVPERVLEALERANAFHRELLAIYADPDARSAFRDVEALVSEYRTDPETAFLTDPKELTLVADQSEAGAFREAYPHLHGLMWAHRWLQLAAFEPLIRYQTPERRRAGIMAVMARYWSMLENPPESFPSEMPMAPTIAPALVAYHPGAAAILDNANMFHDVVANTLVHEGPQGDSDALLSSLNRFQDPNYLWASWYNWNRMAIIHGVGNQGGWATDIIPDPQETEIHMDEHGGHMVIPGMPTGME